MSTNLAGELYALAAAFTWAFALVLFKYSGERVSPLSLNLFKAAVGIILLFLTLLAGPFLEPILGDESLARLYEQPARAFGIMIISGIIGIALADTLFFHALNIVGVGIVSIIDCLYTPFVFLFSFVWLHEKLTWLHVAGAVLILAGVLVSSGHKPPTHVTRGRLILGILVGAVAMACMALGIVIAKPALDTFPLIWASTVRLTAGLLALMIIAPMLTPRGAPSVWAVFKPSATWKTAIPGAVLGTYLAYVFWVAGFKYAHAAATVAILNQTTVIFAIILATFIVKEPLTRRKMVSVGLAVTGVLVTVMQDKIVTWWYGAAPAVGM
jgi:drug/metabolite transporter (DMT)-like permease